MNWRKPIILAALKVSGSSIPSNLREIHNLGQMSQEDLKTYQEAKLNDLLLHAYENVPYYHKILGEVGVIANGKVVLDNFHRIPVLTKDIIMREKENLYSLESKDRISYFNTSGGSTGEPVLILQDKTYDEWNTATKLYFNQMLNKEIGEKEIKFWGSERDIFTGTIGLKNKLMNYLYNRNFINSFKLDMDNLTETIKRWNSFKPKVVWSYVDSAYELARFVERNKLEIYSPESVIVTAGVLTEDIRSYIENALGTQVYNQYGSREVGAIACECTHKEGLHIFDHLHYLEVQNDDLLKKSDLLVTNLTNYSMPLIRYQIGDTVKMGQKECSCGRPFSMIESITGRITNHFIKNDGSIVHGEYFTHLFYFKEGIKKFQVLQQDYDIIICKIIKSEDFKEEYLKDIKGKIQLVMGENCKVIFEFVDEIQPSKSGKFLYTISEVPTNEE